MHDDDFQPKVGKVFKLEPGLDLILAPNPSPMTGQGTNTYLLGTDSLAVIDPGPLDETHQAALLAAIDERPVTHIIVTHSHLDQSPLAKPLSDATGASVYGFGDTFEGRSDVMTQLADAGMKGGGEGLDLTFVPDVIVADGDRLTGQGWALDVIHTPGHLGNHIALKWNDAVFVGDLVMGWSTSLVSPPDGDMSDFLASCARLMQIPARVYYAGHGAPISTPHARLAELIAHRAERTSQIMGALGDTGISVVQLVDCIYVDLDPRLKLAAGRNVLAHLIDLYSKGSVNTVGALGPDALFRLTSTGLNSKKNQKSK